MEIRKVESGVQLFSRLNQKKTLDGINPKLFPDGGPHPNEIIEISGEDDASIDLLIDFIARCILPEELNPEWRGSEVIVIINEHRIDLLKIVKVLECHLSTIQLKEPKRKIVESCLERMIMINCYSQNDLEMSIFNLKRLIYDSVSLVVVDNITSYYWISKLSMTKLSYYQHSLRMLEMLREVINNTNIVLIFISQGRMDNKRDLPYVDYKLEIQMLNNNNFNVVINNEKDKTKSVSCQVHSTLQFKI